MSISNYSQAILPKTWQNKLDAQFQKTSHFIIQRQEL